MQEFNDPLAKFRRKPIEPQSTVATRAVSGPPEYVAFDAKDAVLRLRIRAAGESTYAIRYEDLRLIAYDRRNWTNFVLIFGLLTVEVRGKNLQPIVTALETNSADFIQEYDPTLWQKPSDPTAPFIESMEVVSNDDTNAESGNQTEASTKPH